SRRNETEPPPPLPAWTRMRTASTKVGGSADELRPRGRVEPVPLSCSFSWGYADAAPILAHALVYDLAVYQGEKAVVAPFAHSRPGLDVGAPLPNDDRPCPDGRAAEDLDPQALRVGVAAVAGGAAALFVCHLLRFLRRGRLG